MNVSIVIPAYNAAATIGETLESVRAQTHAGWEAIVVDDGSSDGTGDLARAYHSSDPRFRVVDQPNGGESAARNAGLDHVRYEWLLFLDADDWIAPGHLERLTRELLARPELDAVHCGSVRVAADGTHVPDGYEPPEGDLFPTLARRAAFPVHACLVRRSLVEAVGRFDVSLRKSPDWDLWQRIARTGAHFGAVREVLAYYRMQPQSASLAAEQLFRDGLRVLRRGHAPDPRVPNPTPDHAGGMPADQIRSQVFYLLSWCAGLMLGSGENPEALFDAIGDDVFPELYPPAVAQCIFESAPLPACQTRQAWQTLWPAVHERTASFLATLEARSHAPDLARLATAELKKMVLRHSPWWAPTVGEWERRIEELQRRCDGLTHECAELQRHAEERAALSADLSRTRWVRVGARLRLIDTAR